MRELVIDPKWEKITCPYCRKLIYFDNERKRTYHQVPLCVGFRLACAETRGHYHGEAQLKEPKVKA